MRKLIALATTALFTTAVALPAHAAPKRQDAPATASTPSADPQADAKRYCVVTTTTGSRLAKKTCKTRAEWIADEDFDPLAPRQ